MSPCFLSCVFAMRQKKICQDNLSKILLCFSSVKQVVRKFHDDHFSKLFLESVKSGNKMSLFNKAKSIQGVFQGPVSESSDETLQWVNKEELHINPVDLETL